MGKPNPFYGLPFNGGKRRELKHLSTFRKRKKFDSESSGERNRISLNSLDVIARRRCLDWVAGIYRFSLRREEKVTN